MENVVVLGAGSWGTALAVVLAENGHNTLIWSHREDQASEINEQHTNKKYLPNTILPRNLKATSNLEEAAQHRFYDCYGSTDKRDSRSLRQHFGSYLTEKALFVHVSKGIEPDTLMRISELMKESLLKMR